MLYSYLKYFHGIAAAHTSATGMGTDWRDNDPAAEPVVEIYQGDRQNYEMPDAPRSNSEKDSIGNWRPKGFVSLALAKGYKLGFDRGRTSDSPPTEEHGADPERAAPQSTSSNSLKLLRQAREHLGEGLRAVEADRIAESDGISLRSRVGPTGARSAARPPTTPSGPRRRTWMRPGSSSRARRRTSSGWSTCR